MTVVIDPKNEGEMDGPTKEINELGKKSSWERWDTLKLLQLCQQTGQDRKKNLHLYRYQITLEIITYGINDMQ